MPTTTEVNAAAENFIADTNTADAKINGPAGTVTDRHGTVTKNVEQLLLELRERAAFTPAIPFELGLSVADGSFTVVYAGQVYAALASETPFTTTGIFDFAQWYPISAVNTRQIFVDASNGSDSNTGYWPNAPLQTLEAAQALAVSMGTSVSIFLAAGLTWRSTLDISNVPFSLVEGYGNLQGLGLPVVRGDDVITETWQDNSDRSDAHANVYSFQFNYTFSLGQQAVPPHVYEDGELLTWVADVATCQSTPGSFTHDATTSDVTGVTVYVHPTGSGDPASNGKEYSHTTRTWAVKVGDDSTVRLVHGMNQAHDNGSINGGDRCLFEKCLANGSPIHDMLAASGVMRECISWHPFRDTRSGAILLEFFRADGDGHTVKWERCITVGSTDGTLAGFGGHVASGQKDGSNLYDRADMVDCLAHDSEVNFDDVKHMRSERVKTTNGSIRWVSYFDGGSSVIIDPCIISDALPGGIGGTNTSQSGDSTLTIDGARIYCSVGDVNGFLGGNYADIRNSVVVYEGDADPEFFRSTAGDMTLMKLKGNVFEHKGTGDPLFLYYSETGATIENNDNVFIGSPRFTVNGSSWGSLDRYQTQESQDADSLSNKTPTGSDGIGITAILAGDGWTNGKFGNADGTWDQDGAGSGSADRIQFYTGTGTPVEKVFAFTVSGPGTIDVQDGVTTIANDLPAGTYAYSRVWDGHISLAPNGNAVTISAASLFDVETSNLATKDPSNGDFRMVGDVGTTLAGLVRPGARYLEAPTSLAACEDWILSQG